jgi:hypothetical protein
MRRTVSTNAGFMITVPAVITSGIDPTIELALFTSAWDRLTIALGALAVAFDARRRGLDPERMHAGD